MAASPGAVAVHGVTAQVGGWWWQLLGASLPSAAPGLSAATPQWSVALKCQIFDNSEFMRLYCSSNFQ